MSLEKQKHQPAFRDTTPFFFLSMPEALLLHNRSFPGDGVFATGEDSTLLSLSGQVDNVFTFTLP